MAMSLEAAKNSAYVIVVLAFVFAGAIDLKQGAIKLGVVGLLFALINGVVFLWR